MRSVSVRLPSFLGKVVALLAVAMLAGYVCGCGGGGGTSGGGGGGGGGQPQDFSLSVSSSSLAITGGGSASFNASVSGVNGFASTVSLSISGLPAGVTASPANLLVTPGTPLQITLTAAATVAATSASLTVSGVSGTLSHSAQLSLTVNALAGSPLISRTRYVRTDSVTEYPYWENQNWIVFDPGTKRFFVADPSGNQVVVMDATKRRRSHRFRSRERSQSTKRPTIL